ncbi:RHS repeat domain-containing protein, partial [Streptomyces otsuchiensis]|uniref:RHS repeat domain-containing protein n=1 Tax=Streptomyces otsuchiensis TaxID=2681388 RepID=UPI001D13190B
MVATLLQAMTVDRAAAEGGRPDLPDAEEAVEGRSAQPVAPRGPDHLPPKPPGEPEVEMPGPGRAKVSVNADEFTAVDGIPVSVAADRRVTADVEILGEKAAEMVGAAGPVVVLSTAVSGVWGQERFGVAVPPAGEEPVVEVDVRLDYREFAEAFGGGFGSRLTLVELPECAATTPELADCQERKPVDALNDVEERTLTAHAVALDGSAAVLAVVSSEEGEQGDYKATDLAASATWDTSLNTGDFTWSHPLPTPEVPGGLAPELELSYSSGSIDGRTGGTNNQSSWVGDGFDLWPGYIERKYKECGYDEVENADGHNIGDLCWDYDNAFISFNGGAGELVPAGANRWKLKNDDGTVVERLTDSARANGDNDNEYWRVTVPGGTQYYFGYHRLPGWSTGRAVTNSAWTVPVFGNDAGDPCYRAQIKDAWCQQAWRWNLDYVVDTRGNALTYYYDREQNSYSRFLDTDNNTRYTRGGSLNRIEYGLTKDTVYGGAPLAKVQFTNSERCLEGNGADCSDITTNPFSWYDTPWDLNCNAGAECDRGRYSPTFWTTKRLTGVTTQVRVGTGYQNVDSWKLAHHWGTADVDYQLLLSSVQHTGHAATPAVTLPRTTFGYTQLANRMDRTGDGYAPFVKARLSSVADEVGGQIDVGYSAPACNASNLPTPQSNTTRCFPQYLGGGPDHDPELHWFNKYVVESVTATDRTGGSPDQVTRYQYLGGAAWHYDDDSGLVPDEEKTWSQWRGYGQVRVRSGGQSAMLSQSDHYFLRGMHGDRARPSGGTKTVNVALGAGEGEPITDHRAHAGFPYKTVTFSGDGGQVLEKSVSRPWRHQTAERVRDWGTVSAQFTGTAHSKSWTSLDDGAGAQWRTTEEFNTYDTVAGRLTQVDDRGDTATSADDRCARVTYASTELALLGLPSRSETVGVRCSATPDRSKDVLSDTLYAYDGRAYGQEPTFGDITATAVLKSHNGTTGTYLESGATYDAFGRVTSTTDLTADVTATNTGTPIRTPRSDGRTSTTAYAPATGFPNTITETTPPATAGNDATRQTTVTTLSGPRRLPTRLRDTNGKETNLTYDALGRSTKVWLPDRRTGLVPSHEFTYRIVEGQPVSVGAKTIGNDDRQDTAYTLYDGFLRERQTQEPGPDGGRLLTDVFYDERGLPAKTFAPYFTGGLPAQAIFRPADESVVESQTRTTFDGLGREAETRLVAGDGDGGRVLSVTQTIHGGDRVTVIPPVGGTATTKINDARGQLTELRELHQRSAGAAFDATRYQYTARGELSTVTDPAGNQWSYVYDQLGRQISSTDPDAGTSTTHYDDRGQKTSTTNARGVTLAYVQDGLGRQTELREGGPDGELRAQWVYDTLTGARGYLAKSTRWENGNPYVSEVLQYDRLYRPTSTQVVIPASEGALAGTYESGTSYDSSGMVRSIGLPAAGSLPGDSFAFTYEDRTLRLLSSAGGQGVRMDATYSLTGKPREYELSANGGKTLWVTNTYEWGTQRLKTARVDRLDQPVGDRHETYAYDQVGNVLSIAEVSSSGTDIQCFAYDHVRRLTEGWTQGAGQCAASGAAATVGGPAPYHHAYTYDKVGNRLTETLHEQGIEREYTYSESQPHAVTEVIQDAPGVRSLEEYGYDATGNTVSRQLGGETQTLSWNPEGRVAEVENADGTGAEYLYTADGIRLIGRTSMETTLYLGHTEVTVTAGSSTPKAIRYVDIGGGHQAVIDNDGNTVFTLADHHATGQIAVDAATQAVTRRRTLPFGGIRGASPGAEWPGTRTFVGGTTDATTGLYNIGAREYDPALGRFISLDP